MELKRISEDVLYVYNWKVKERYIYFKLFRPRGYPYLCLPRPDFRIVIDTASSGIIFK